LHSIDTKLRACDARVFWPISVRDVLFDCHEPILSQRGLPRYDAGAGCGG
jgi:hypothetical protein